MSNRHKDYWYRFDITYTEELEADGEDPYYGELWRVQPHTLERIEVVTGGGDWSGWSVDEVLIGFASQMFHMVRLGCTVILNYEVPESEGTTS